MGMQEVAVQSYCFRGFKDNRQTAQKVKDIGLKAIELCGVHVDFGNTAVFDEALKIYKDAGVKIVSIGVQPDSRLARDAGLELGINGSIKVDRYLSTSDPDILAVRLTGRLLRGVRYAAAGPELRPRAFHVRIDARAVRPDYDLAALRAADPVTTEDRFARALLERLDAETDPERRADLESALFYGLDAFRLHEVVPAYEELGS